MAPEGICVVCNFGPLWVKGFWSWQKRPFNLYKCIANSVFVWYNFEDLAVKKFPLPEYFPTASKERFPLLSKKDAPAEEVCTTEKLTINRGQRHIYISQRRVIEFGDSYQVPQEDGARESSVKKKGRTVAVTTEDLQNSLEMMLQSRGGVWRQGRKQVGMVPTTSPIFTTASVVTPYSRRKGKEKMVESDTPKKKKLQEQIDVQERIVGNKMLKSFPLPVKKFPLPEYFPTASEERFSLLSKRDAPAKEVCTAEKLSINRGQRHIYISQRRVSVIPGMCPMIVPII
uniref:Uncharacterized protein n=1 Tax=Tanacetum cinerariifolium TaxID=118510 RepID=A0A6L2LH13_TANCI|nr:hypothetical protein [Tanacetum cinerariifolium]